jgi:hypothetical protein
MTANSASIGTGRELESTMAIMPTPQKPSLANAGTTRKFHFAISFAKNDFNRFRPGAHSLQQSMVSRKSARPGG